MAGHDLLCIVETLLGPDDVCNCIPAEPAHDWNKVWFVSKQAGALWTGSELRVVNGKFCQKHMPLYKAVCKNPSAASHEGVIMIQN